MFGPLFLILVIWSNNGTGQSVIQIIKLMRSKYTVPSNSWDPTKKDLFCLCNSKQSQIEAWIEIWAPVEPFFFRISVLIRIPFATLPFWDGIFKFEFGNCGQGIWTKALWFNPHISTSSWYMVLITNMMNLVGACWFFVIWMNGLAESSPHLTQRITR